MKIELTKEEVEYLSKAPFWDWKRAELDLKIEELWLGDNKKAVKKARKYHAKQEKFYRELYEKLRSIT